MNDSELTTVKQHVDHVVHELRSPLAVIEEYAELLADGSTGPISEIQLECARVIQRRAKALLDLIDSVLNVSRLQAGGLVAQRCPCPVAGLLDNVKEVLCPHSEAKNQTLKIIVPPHVPDVFCDEDQVGRILVNLGMNAIKFTPPNGRVVIEIFLAGDGEVEFRVRDSGSGMSPQQLEKVFDRFRQGGEPTVSKADGFGLGLYLVKQLARLNATDINVKSQPGRGTQFSFRIATAVRGVDPTALQEQNKNLERTAADMPQPRTQTAQVFFSKSVLKRNRGDHDARSPT